MTRHLLVAVVVVADTALMAGHPGGLPLWGVPIYALAVAMVIALGHRTPMAAFVAALVLASLTGGSFVLLLWAAYQAGHAVLSRSDTAMVVGAALGGLGVQFVTESAEPQAIPRIVSTYVVFVALPLLAGRYLAQHERLVSALDQHNRQLRRQRELLVEQERLGERLRIARDMHDSLGHRLSLVSVQAAALEVSPLPPQQRQAVEQLAKAARGAMNELYELVGVLRAEDETPGRSPGVEAIGTVVEEFQAAGVTVTLRQRGEPRLLSPAAGQAAYRVVEEGLTNAAKHAPDQPITVSVEWEPDTLLLTVANPLQDHPVLPAAEGARHGLSGLGERVRPVGGVLDHSISDGMFRLVAMLPAVAEELPVRLVSSPGETADDDDLPAVGHIRTVVIGFATAVLMFALLPASMLLGVR
ncbi:sensor histidine kinase [Planotetraspora sp. GP83]|uniref:sensor histidine kinase n=1 Tax=Planotetraspora sp. GP83 TaxID=3156264 RepID=UPI0035158494